MLAFEAGFVKAAGDFTPEMMEAGLAASHAPEATWEGDRLPMLRGEEEAIARKFWEAQQAKSFALRHPWLTGIPTLGLWPTAAHWKAMAQAGRNLPEQVPNFMSQLMALEDAVKQRSADEEALEHQRRTDLLPLLQQEETTNRHTALAGIASGAALSGLGSYLNSRKPAQEEEEY